VERSTADFSEKPWKWWDDIFTAVKERVSTKNLYPTKLSFKTEGEIKSFLINKN